MTKILPIHIVGVHVIKPLINSQEDQLEKKLTLHCQVFKELNPRTFLMCCCLFRLWIGLCVGHGHENFLILT
jgi:hypothetical protein